MDKIHIEVESSKQMSPTWPDVRVSSWQRKGPYEEKQPFEYEIYKPKWE